MNIGNLLKVMERQTESPDTSSINNSNPLANIHAVLQQAQLNSNANSPLTQNQQNTAPIQSGHSSTSFEETNNDENDENSDKPVINPQNALNAIVSGFNKKSNEATSSNNPLSAILANNEKNQNKSIHSPKNIMKNGPQLINLPNPPNLIKRPAPAISPSPPNFEINQQVVKLEQINTQINAVQQVLSDLQSQKQSIIDKITGSVKSALSGEVAGPVDTSGLLNAILATQNGGITQPANTSMKTSHSSNISSSAPPSKKQAFSNNNSNLPTSVASLIKNISPVGGKSTDSANSSNENLSNISSLNIPVSNSTDILTNILKGQTGGGASSVQASMNSGSSPNSSSTNTSQISPNLPFINSSSNSTVSQKSV